MTRWTSWPGVVLRFGLSSTHALVLIPVHLKHGDLFTFILFGRRVTAGLGPKGNNFILGGKLSDVSAEEVYTVS